MKIFVLITFFCLTFKISFSQIDSTPDFKWGNSYFYNLDVGEAVLFNSVEVKLIDFSKSGCRFKIRTDTVLVHISRRALPIETTGLKIFVADCKYYQNLAENKNAHTLLKKDVLICINYSEKAYLKPMDFTFPISFNDGYFWNCEENSSMFSIPYNSDFIQTRKLLTHEGIDFDIHDARGLQKHWIVAIENCRIVWIENSANQKLPKETSVLLQSNSNPAIFYLYQHLFQNNLKVKRNQKLNSGDVIGTVLGDENWGHLHFAVIYSDTIPTYKNRLFNILNCFPQIYELYYKQTYPVNKTFTRGRILFGKSNAINRNDKNNNVFEEFSGKGWLLDKSNLPQKTEWISKGQEGNVRLRKILFENTKAEYIHFQNYFDYEINCPNGLYRIRAYVGDLALQTWQKVDFEGINASTFLLKPGELKWTNERVVNVRDHKLSIRIYLDDKNHLPAGISEIVFQQSL